MAKEIISIDLETLDVTKTAVILEIGIAVGDSSGNLIERFQMFPNVQEQLAAGRSVSGDTILWWMKQADAISLEQANAPRHPVADCLRELRNFLDQYKQPSYVLGNAPSFDCDILSDFMGEKPWPFWVERDVRTARMKVPHEQRAVNHAEHSGLSDAIAQLQDFATFLGK